MDSSSFKHILFQYFVHLTNIMLKYIQNNALEESRSTYVNLYPIYI